MHVQFKRIPTKVREYMGSDAGYFFAWELNGEHRIVWDSDKVLKRRFDGTRGDFEKKVRSWFRINKHLMPDVWFEIDKFATDAYRGR